MKKHIILFFLPILFCLSACENTNSNNIENSNPKTAYSEGTIKMVEDTRVNENINADIEGNNLQTVYSESVKKIVDDTRVNENINAAIEKKKKELNLSDMPFGVTDIYIGTMFDYNNDNHKDYVVLYALYAQFELVVFDSQNSNILLEDRVMMHISPKTEIKIYHNSDSGYLFRITYQELRPQVPIMVETIQFITGFEENILEAVYDSDTNSFNHGYFNYSAKYNYDEYTKKQEELLNGYDYYMDLKFEIYENTFK